MINHISIGTKNFEQSRDSYDKQEAGYGKNGKIGFLLFKKKKFSENEQEEQVGQANGLHVCFEGQNAESIQKWHKKCLELGGQDNGKPGPRDIPGYYAAYVVDPNGWRTEACVFNPQ
jgi:catechol 2,3-dioxygenase-like lactoylglutathione lyase family enzyme